MKRMCTLWSLWFSTVSYRLAECSLNALLLDLFCFRYFKKLIRTFYLVLVFFFFLLWATNCYYELFRLSCSF